MKSQIADACQWAALRQAHSLWRSRYVDELDELQSEACVSVLGRLPSFDSSRSSISTYLERSADWGVKGAIRRTAEGKERHSAITPKVVTGEIPDVEAQAVDPDIGMYLDELLALVSPRDRKVLVMYSQGYSLEEIGCALGVSQSRASQIKKRALRLALVRCAPNVRIASWARKRGT